MKAFTDLFIKRPVLALVISVSIVVAGLQAIGSLSVRQYPRSDNAVVTITTTYIGASAELVRGFITTPLERVVASVDGVDYVSSQSQQNVSIITARLKINYDPVKALSEISTRVDQVRTDLPPEAEVPVMNIESADSQFAAAYLSFSSDILDDNQVTDYLVRVVQPRLSSLSGVQRAEVLGGRTFAMRIWLKSQAMAAYGVTPLEVRNALAANNFLAAIGQIKGSMIQMTLNADTDLNSVQDFEQLIVRSDDTAVLRLKDIAEVELGAESYDSVTRFSGEDAVFMGIWPLPNSNSLEVIDLVEAEMRSIQETLPRGMSGHIAYDATEYIDNSIKEVIKTLGETLLIVILVICLFMGSLRTVLIPIAAIPISLIGAVFFMQVFGFSLNLLTLLAIVLAVGLVVDDAIIVVENIERHMSNGMSKVDAALRGARELIGPVIATTAVLVAVYVPVAFQGGLTGSLFKEFALTLSGAVIVSSIVALTLSPMMSSKILTTGGPSRFAQLVARGFDRLKRSYSKQLDTVLQYRGAAYFTWATLTLLCIPMFMFSAGMKELAPMEDQGVIFSIIDTGANNTIDQSALYAQAVNEEFQKLPESEFTFQLTFPTAGFGGVVLKPWDERERTAQQIQPQLQMALDQIPGFSLFAITPPALPGGGDFAIEFILTSTAEPEIILDVMNALREKGIADGIFAFPPIIDTKIDQGGVSIELDREKMATLGLTAQQVGLDLGTLLGGNYVNRFNMDGRSYRVIPQLRREERLTPENLKDLYITGPENELMRLENIADINLETRPRSLNRFQQMNSVKMSGVPMMPLNQALAYLNEEAAKIMPQDFNIDYTGESRQLMQEGGGFAMSFGLAIVMVFLVLAAQFNSLRDPFIIIIGCVPMAMFGAMIFVFLRMPNPMIPHWTDGFTSTLNIYSQVGLVTLVGLIAKNGILIVEFANKLQEKGIAKLTAIKHAAAIRLRPILMTAVATVAGHFPLILVTGAGAAARNSIGVVLVLGMAIGTLLTVYLVPPLYMLFARNEGGNQTEVDENQLNDIV